MVWTQLATLVPATAPRPEPNEAALLDQDSVLALLVVPP